MIRRSVATVVTASMLLGAFAENPNRVRPLADEFTVVCRSADPENVFCYTPGICRLDTGRLVATCDYGGPGMQGEKETGRIYLSDDRGVTWRQTGTFALCHARPFVAGGRLYVLGHRGDLGAVVSDDGGESWSETRMFGTEQKWHASACNVWYEKGNVYLAMENMAPNPEKRDYGWGVDRLRPVLMRAKASDDLTEKANWTFAETFHFDALFDENPDMEFRYFGVPWYKAFTAYQWKNGAKWENGHPDAVARCQPTGWLETNVVRIMDPDDEWYDPSGSTFHLFMRSNTSGSGYAALAKVKENADGTMTTSLEKAPSGVPTLFVPFPGGQMRFHVLWDDRTRLYWLLSTQATDTMVRREKLPEGRYNLPYDERQRLQLLFSKNMMDWCFAGIVTIGASVKESRHYASMAIDGDDLVILSRSGTPKAKTPHNVDMITFHRITDFRSLVY